MSKIADVAFEKIDTLSRELFQMKTALAEREAQLLVATEALEGVKQHGSAGSPASIGEIAAAALSRLPAPATLVQELRATVRQQTARECVSLIYPDGNPEIAIRRIKQDFMLMDTADAMNR